MKVVRSNGTETVQDSVQEHPLGPILRRRRFLDARGARTVAVIVLIGCVAPLVVAGLLDPDPRGVGTHEQLGFPGCMTIVATGVPCPACGMTTAFAHTVRGQWIRAAVVQPMGFVLALACVVAMILATDVLITGCGWRVNWYRVSPTMLAIAVGLLAAASWGYKVVVTCFVR